MPWCKEREGGRAETNRMRWSRLTTCSGLEAVQVMTTTQATCLQISIYVYIHTFIIKIKGLLQCLVSDTCNKMYTKYVFIPIIIIYYCQSFARSSSLLSSVATTVTFTKPSCRVHFAQDMKALGTACCRHQVAAGRLFLHVEL